MSSIVLVGKDLAPYTEFVSVLDELDRVTVTQVNSGKEVVEMLGVNNVDVVVCAETLVDGTGISFAEELMKKNPLINCAIASSLEPKEFHEQTEGLGIFMQLPILPRKEDAEKMIQILDSINALLAS